MIDKIRNVLVLLVFTSGTMYSQIKITGAIYDSIGRPVQSASITVSNKYNNLIVAYCLSDERGFYSMLLHPAISDSLKLVVSSISYAKAELIIPAISGSFNFSLKMQPLLLKEVKIKSLPVWQRKDTINYNVAEFTQQQDRVIGDIIKRLPGIEVSPGGQIKYNGKPINKYYIEGLDLLEDKYGLANNNIPSGSVDKVQVLENHQPIKLLDSISFSDRAALNIVLKPTAKAKLIGRAKLGVGVSPLLSEDELTAMLFKKNYQFLNTYKYNNTGIDNKNDLTSQNIAEYINAIKNGAVKSDLVSIIEPKPPPGLKSRYLFNNEHTVAVNQLIPLNPIYQLRINVSYVNDFQQQQSGTTTVFYLPADTLSISENNNYHGNVNIVQSDIALMANTAKYYVRNVLKFQNMGSVEKNRLIANSEIRQQVNNPFFSIANDFKLLVTRKKFIREWSAYMGYVSLPQSLTIYPGLYQEIIHNNLAYDALVQQASLRTFFSDNYLSLRRVKSKVSQQYKIGFNIQSQFFQTNLLINEAGNVKTAGENFQNKLKWRKYSLYGESNWGYENAKWRLMFSLPVNITRVCYTDTIAKLESAKTGFFINPVTTAMFQINPFWNISSTCSLNNGFGDISNINRGYILKTYRNLSNNDAPLAKMAASTISATITFRNPLKIIFFNNDLSVSRIRLNLLYKQLFVDNLETLTAIIENNYNNKLSFSGRFSKYIMKLKTSIGFNYLFSTGKQQQLQQSKLINLSNNNFVAGSTIAAKISSYIAIEYNGNYLNYTSASQLQKRVNKIKITNQKLSFTYYPSQSFILKLSAEQYYSSNSFSAPVNCYFTDMNLRYTTKKKKIDYELICQNLLNTKRITSVLLLNNIETTSVYQIRPRQVLVKVSFNF